MKFPLQGATYCQIGRLYINSGMAPEFLSFQNIHKRFALGRSLVLDSVAIDSVCGCRRGCRLQSMPIPIFNWGNSGLSGIKPAVQGIYFCEVECSWPHAVTGASGNKIFCTIPTFPELHFSLELLWWNLKADTKQSSQRSAKSDGPFSWSNELDEKPKHRQFTTSSEWSRAKLGAPAYLLFTTWHRHADFWSTWICRRNKKNTEKLFKFR